MKVSRVLLIAGVTLVVAALPARAQVGLQAGWNYSMPSIEAAGASFDAGDRSGFNFGIYTARGGLLGYVVGLYYSQKGFDVDTARVNLNYIEAPAMLVVDIPFVRAYGGVNLAFEIDCSIERAPAPNGVPFFCEQQTETFDFGFKVGAGGKLLMFTLDVAYIWSTTDVWKTDQGSIKHRVLQVDLGLRL